MGAPRTEALVEAIKQGADGMMQKANEAFPYLVHYTWAQATANIIMGSMMLSIGAFAMNAWLNALKEPPKSKYDFGEREARIAIAMVLTAVGFITGTIAVWANLAEFIEPTGATIHYLTRRFS